VHVDILAADRQPRTLLGYFGQERRCGKLASVQRSMLARHSWPGWRPAPPVGQDMNSSDKLDLSLTQEMTSSTLTIFLINFFIIQLVSITCSHQNWMVPFFFSFHILTQIQTFPSVKCNLSPITSALATII
jgi:hypothetical protein